MSTYKDLGLEVKQPCEQFQEPKKGEYTIRIAFWRDYVDELEEDSLVAINAKVNFETTIDELVNSINTDKKSKSIYIYSKSYNATDRISMALLNPPECGKLTMRELRIYDWSLLYAEVDNQKDSWLKYFEDVRTRIYISFNSPGGIDTDYPFKIMANNKNTVNEVRSKIAKMLCIEPLSFIMRRGSKLGPEIKQHNATLASLAFIKNSTLYLEKGIPKQEGEYFIQIAQLEIVSEKEENSINKFTPIFNIIVNGKQTFYELKLQIIAQYKDVMNQDVQADKMRIRDTNGERATCIMKNQEILENTYIYDYKSYCVQLLDKPEILTEDDIFLYIREWNRATYELSPIKEIQLQKSKPLMQILDVLGVPNDKVIN